jgi:hypothetical protein
MRPGSPSIRRALVLAPLAAVVLAAAGCASTPATPSATYRPPADGSTFVYRVTSTGSFGNGTVEMPMRFERGTFEGREVMRLVMPSNTSVVEPSTAWIIGIFDPQGRPALRYDPPLGQPWPLAVGKTATQQLKVTTGPNPPMAMTANWKVEAVEDVTVPAGTFRAWRVVMTDSFGFRQVNWSVPDALGIFARRESMRPPGHPQGEGTQTLELLGGPRR